MSIGPSSSENQELRSALNGLNSLVKRGAVNASQLVETLSSKIDDNLPKLVVVGTQSAGKSTLLNALLPQRLREAGMCLPTSDGMCTKFRLHIAFRCGPNERIELHDSKNETRRFFSTAEAPALQALFEAYNKEPPFSRDVYVTFESPDASASDFAIVDLPGLAPASQDRHVAHLIREEVVKEIKTAHILLVVEQALSDPASWQSLALCRPGTVREGARIIPVLTYGDRLLPEKLAVADAYFQQRGYSWAVTAAKFAASEELQKLQLNMNGAYTPPAHVYVGTQNLSRFLDRQYLDLFTLMCKNLKEPMHALLATVEEDIRRYGERPRSAEDICAQVRAQIDLFLKPPAGKSNSYLQSMQQLEEGLKSFPSEKYLDSYLRPDVVKEIIETTKSSERVPIEGMEGPYEYICTAFVGHVARDLVPDLVDRLTKFTEKGVALLFSSLKTSLHPKDQLSRFHDKVRTALSEVIYRFRDEKIEELRQRLTNRPMTHKPFSLDRVVGFIGEIIRHLDVRMDVLRLPERATPMSAEEYAQLFAEHQRAFLEVTTLLAQLKTEVYKAEHKDQEVVEYNVRTSMLWFWVEAYLPMVRDLRTFYMNDQSRIIHDTLKSMSYKLSVGDVDDEAPEIQSIRNTLLHTRRVLRSYLERLA